MKVAIYYPRALLGDGGATLSVRGWASALSAAGAEVVMVCAPGGGAIAGAELRTIRHQRVGAVEVPIHFKRHVEDADLVWLHSGWVAHNIAVARGLRGMGVPYVVTPHGAYDPRILARRRRLKNAWWSAAERPLLDGAAAVHVFFASEIASLRALGYTGRTLEAPNGIDVPAQPSWDGGSSGAVLWLGRYDVEHKGLDLLIRALASIPETDRPHIRLHGPESRDGRGRVSDLARDAGIAAFVEANSPIYGVEKEQALTTAEAFVYPSRWDSHSIAMLEAASRGVPLVTTTSTEFGPQLAAAGAAFVADPTPESIADALIRSRSPEGSSVGRQAHAVSLARYAWPAVGQSMVTQLETLLSSSS